MSELDKLVRKSNWGETILGAWFFHGKPDLDEAEAELSVLRAELKEALGLLQRVQDSCDSDWWAEVDDLEDKTPYEVELTAGLLWDIAGELKGR